MTALQLYEGVLIELNKDSAPNILLETFNYLANKAVNLYINKKYNIYDINQQATDDLRVLKATALLIPQKCTEYNALTLTDNMATYYVDLPSDYLHLLNCICIYNVKKTYKCYNKGNTWRAAAKRLTADAYSQVLDNFWNKPSYKNPYYYIHNINLRDVLPTSDENDIHLSFPTEDLIEKDSKGNIILDNSDSVLFSNIKYKADLENNPRDISNVQRTALLRYGNASKVRLEIRYGTDTSVFSLDHEEGKKGGLIYIDYLKAPLHIRLTQEELDNTEDTSQVLEFPDYVCQEILNELVHIIMENISDLRLQTHPVVSLSIANPAQALAPEAAGQSAS